MVGVLLIALLCRSASAVGETPFHQQGWTIDDGLPVNVVNALLQDRSGYLWLATNDGLVRFDGFRFTVFNTVSNPPMQSNRILGLAEAADGSLWWWTEQMHLVSLADGEFRHHTEADGLPHRDVQRIVSDRQGRLWFATRGGLAYLDRGTIRALETDTVGGEVNWMQPVDDGEVWYRGEAPDGIYRYRDGAAERLLPAVSSEPVVAFHATDAGELLVSDGGRIWRHDGRVAELISRGLPEGAIISAIATDPLGRLWAASQQHGVFVREDGTWNARFEDGRTPVEGRAFMHDGAGDFWVVTDHAIHRNGEPVFRADSEISDALIDDEGNLWVSLSRDGIRRLQPARLTTHGRADGLPEPNLYPVLAARDGSVWVGTFGQGPARWIDGRFESGFEQPETPGRQFTYSLLERRNGQLLASVTQQILRFRPAQARFEAFEPALDADLFTYALFEDRRQRVWAGTDGGVFVLEDGRWRAVLDDPRHGANYVRHFAEAGDGSLWMATNGQGLLILRDGELLRLRQADGLLSDNLRALWFDPEAEGRVLWVGSEDSGLQRLSFVDDELNNPDSFTVRQAQGLFDNVIHAIVPDRQGRLWMNSNRGLFWVERDALEALAAGRAERIQSIAYGPEDGLGNREGNGGIHPAFAVDADGVLWFPTQGGLVEVDPARIARNPKPARAVIESLSSRDSVLPWSGAPEMNLANDQRDFRIRYTGISLTDPPGVRFRYRLAGYDGEWRSTTRREAAYTNIPAGEYRFELLAANSDGVWSLDPAGLSLRIAPYFRETLWFRSLLVLMLGLGIAALVRWRTARMRQHRHELEQLVSERTSELRTEKERTERQARDLKKLDEAKTRFFTNISHEFRTPLTLIMGPVKEFLGRGRISARDREGHEMVLRNSKYLLRLINQILDLSRLEGGEICLQPTHGDLAAFVREVVALFEPVCERQDIALSVEIEPERILLVFDEQRMEQVVANLLSNAIKFTSPGGEVRVEIHDQGELIRLDVVDTGIGVPADEHELVFRRFYQADTAASRAGEGTGVGLSLVRNLVELHGGEILLESAPGRGSRFTILLDRRSLAGQAESPAPDRPEVGASIDAGDPPVETDPAPSDGPREDCPTILVADDNADMRAFIKGVLSPDYRVVEAADGREAVERCREALPDLVMLDVMMPEMDGFAAARAIQSDQELRGIPVLFLTARGGREDRIEGLDSGALAYLSKPFDADVLSAQAGSLITQQMHLRDRLRQAGSAVARPADAFEARVVEVLGERFMDAEFGVAELADAVHLDRTQLFRRIKRSSALSPSKYIQHFRLERAAELLAGGRSPSVSQVAYGCGFNSLSWFSKCFREQFGTRPGDYCGVKRDHDRDDDRGE